MSCASVGLRSLWIISDGGIGNRIANASEPYCAVSVPARVSHNVLPSFSYRRPRRTYLEPCCHVQQGF
jgi:hypothetical protein